MSNGRFLVSVSDQDRLIRLVENGFAYHSMTIISDKSMQDKLQIDQDLQAPFATIALSLNEILETEFLQKAQRGFFYF